MTEQAQKTSFLNAMLMELSRRRVVRTLGTYAVAAFIGLQLLDATGDALLLSQWLKTLVAILVILGFPVVFLLAWVLQWDKQGLRRHEAGALSGPQTSGLFSFMFLLTIGLGAALYHYYGDLLSNAAVSAPTSLVPAGTLSTAPEKSIAVLPFADLSETGDQAHLSDGISEEILNLLSQVEGLQVAARTSSFAFKDQDIDIKEIGRLLNVSKVVEGSVRKYGNQVRLTAQLINVADGFHIWSQNFDRELTDIFAIQDEVARAIADALVESFEGLAADRSPFAMTENTACYEAYRNGRQHWWRRTPDDLTRAVELFASAIREDANFAPAYAGLADSWMLLSSYGSLSPTVALQKAQPAIERALELDPGSAEAFASLGLARWRISQYDAAESALRRAISLNENYTPAKLWLAGVLGDRGRWQEEKQVLEEALLRDPLNELLNNNLASIYMKAGEYDAGSERLTSILQVNPDSALAMRSLANWSNTYGRLVNSQHWASQAVSHNSNDPLALISLGQAWLDLGEVARAERVYDQARQVAANNEDVNWAYFFFLFSQGRLDAMRALLGSEERLNANDPQQQVLLQEDLMQRGLIAMLSGDNAMARDYLRRSKVLLQDPGPDGGTIALLTLLAVTEQLGENPELAEAELLQTEEMLNQARSAGMGLPDLAYAEAIVFALRGSVEQGMDSLELAYQQGFRKLWLLEKDIRLDPLRDEPRFALLLEQVEQDVEQARLEVNNLLAGI